MLYSCKPLLERCKEDAAKALRQWKTPPLVYIVQFGQDDASSRYIRHKTRDFGETGIKYRLWWYMEPLTLAETLDIVQAIIAEGRRERITGIIIQRPVITTDAAPKTAAQQVAALIPPEYDIDGAVPGSPYLPPSVRGLDILLKEWDIDPAGKSAVVIGRGEVGRPVAEYLIGRDATVTVCHSRTPEDVLEDAIQCSDICIGAADMDELLPVSGWPGTVVVDYGIKPGPDGKLHGNFAQSDMTNIDRSIRQTPVPGGMGLMVRAGLLLNIVDAKKRRG